MYLYDDIAIAHNECKVHKRPKTFLRYPSAAVGLREYGGDFLAWNARIREKRAPFISVSMVKKIFKIYKKIAHK